MSWLDRLCCGADVKCLRQMDKRGLARPDDACLVCWITWWVVG